MRNISRFLCAFVCSVVLNSIMYGQGYAWKGVRVPVPMGVQDSSGFTSWQWLNPLPQGNDLSTIFAFDSLEAIAAGRNGTMLRTRNGGQTWGVVHHTLGTLNSFRKIVSPDSGVLIAVTDAFPSGSPVILRSINNGSTWAEIPHQPLFAGLTDVTFLNPTLGFATEEYGKIVRTTDGGMSWTRQYIGGSSKALLGIAFADDSTGYAVGVEGVFVRTTDGGTTWAPDSIGTKANLLDICFADNLRGYIVGWRQEVWGGMWGTLHRTTDGGATWSLQTEITNASWTSIRFSDDHLGIVSGHDYPNVEFLRTTDGGDTWNNVSTNITGVAMGLSSAGTSTWMAVGNGGLIVRSTDQGVSWISLTPAHRKDLNKVHFVSTEVGLALGDRLLMRTTDGGVRWAKASIDTLAYLEDISFVGTSSGFAVGGDDRFTGKIFHTTDAGLSWDEQASGTSMLFGVSFGNSDTGIAVGIDKALVRTTNGGSAWSSLAGFPIPWALGVSMTDGHTAIAVGMNAVGDTGYIARTTDAGNTWTTVFLETTWWGFHGVHFTGYANGVAVGSPGNIMQTTDGGLTWTHRLSLTHEYACTGVDFADAMIGAVVTSTGKILRTLDGGTSWEEWSSPTASFLTSVNFVQSGAGWVGYAVGQQGNIICSAISPLNPRTWTWSGAADSSWNNRDNWLPTGLPLPGDSVVIPPASRSPIIDSLQQQITIASLNILPGGRLTITDVLGRFVVLGDVIIAGTFDIRPPANTVIVVGGSWIVSGAGSYAAENRIGNVASPSGSGGFLAYRSKVIFTGSGKLAGNFYDLVLDTGSTMQSNGSIRVENQCTLVDDLDLRAGDSLIVHGSFPEAIAGRGTISRGTVARAIQQGNNTMYRFGDQRNYVRFDETGSSPRNVWMTTLPDTLLSLKAGDWEVVPSKINSSLNVIVADSVRHFTKWVVGVIRPYTLESVYGDTRSGAQLLRDTLISVRRMYTIQADAGSGFVAQLSLRYDQSEVPPGLSEDSLVLLRSVSTDMVVHLRQGWNMVSVPLKVPDPRRTSLFPGAVSPAFTYGDTYERKDTLERGVGYWIRFSAGHLATIAGLPATNDTIELHPGWNMIGSLSETITSTSIVSDPPGMTTSPFFSYDGRYLPAETIEPGKGYWIKVRESGKLIYSSLLSQHHPEDAPCESCIRIVPTSELPPAPPDGEAPNPKPQIPNQFGLAQNYPNPFNPATTIRFEVPVLGFVTLKVYDVLGQEVATLVDGVVEPGFKAVTWDAAGAPSGVYFYRFTAGSYSAVRKLVLIR